MNVFFSHLNMMPFIYGAVLFLSVFMIIRNITSGQILRALGVAAVIWVGFKMHGDQSETRMAVAIAALCLDMAWGYIVPRRS